MEIELDELREIKFTTKSLLDLQKSGIRVPTDLTGGISYSQLISLLYYGLKYTGDPVRLNQAEALVEEYGYVFIAPIVDAAIMETLIGSKNLKEEVDTKNE